MRKIIRLLENLKVQEILYQHLLNSGLLIELYRNGSLIASEITKRNDILTAKNFVRTTKPPQMTNGRNLENIFQKDNKKIKSMNKDEREIEANKWGEKFVIEHKAAEYVWLYIVGGIIYYMAYKNYSETS